MNLSPYLPPSSGDASVILALVKVLSDPKAAQEMSAKIAAEVKSLEEQIEKHLGILKEATTAREQADHAANDVAAQQASINRQKAELERAKADLAARAVAQAQREDAHSEKAKSLDQELQDLAEQRAQHDRRLYELNEREAGFKIKEKKLNDSVAKHQKWLESLKPPA